MNGMTKEYMKPLFEASRCKLANIDGENRRGYRGLAVALFDGVTPEDAPLKYILKFGRLDEPSRAERLQQLKTKTPKDSEEPSSKKPKTAEAGAYMPPEPKTAAALMPPDVTIPGSLLPQGLFNALYLQCLIYRGRSVNTTSFKSRRYFKRHSKANFAKETSSRSFHGADSCNEAN
jgi:hypothetical protein